MVQPQKIQKQELPIEKEISAGIIIYRNTEEGPKFLILYHGHNYWNFAKGKIESEENSWEAACREIWEETGLRLKDLRFKKNFRALEKFTFRRQGKKIFKTVIFYLAETEKMAVKLPTEYAGREKHEGYGWFLFKEAQQILGRYRDSQRILISAKEFIKFADKNNISRLAPIDRRPTNQRIYRLYKRPQSK